MEQDNNNQYQNQFSQQNNNQYQNQFNQQTNQHQEYNNDKKRKYMFIAGPLILLVALIGITYAFFNYTRTGTANTIKTGRIAFDTEQGTAINLTNMFPIDPEENGIMDESTKVGTVTINVTGDTTYTGGLEYLVTAVNVQNTVGNKSLPISIDVSVVNNSNNDPATTLGTEEEEYFENRGSTTSYYRVLSRDVIENNEQLLVGYIAPGADGVDGNILIKAYLDASKVAISDTYYENAPTPTPTAPNDQYGTPVSFGEGRVVFTTTEWNQLQTNGVSFKVKVEANEGVWVEEHRTVNTMNTFPSTITDQSANIKEVYFNKMGVTRMQNAYDAATIKADLTYNNEGKVLAWLEENPDDNTKYNLIVASDGDTYLTEGSYLFQNWATMEKIEFNNINTSNVHKINVMFGGCSALITLDLSSFDVRNVNEFGGLVNGASSLTNLNLDNWDLSDRSSSGGLFIGATSLANVSCRNWKLPSDMSYWLARSAGIQTIETLDATGWNFGSLTNISNAFNGASKLSNIIGIDTWDLSNVSTLTDIFSGCSSLSNKTFYARTQADADKLNNSSDKPSGLTFVVAP